MYRTRIQRADAGRAARPKPASLTARGFIGGLGASATHAASFVVCLCAVTLSLHFLTGCNMNDPMIREMDSAFSVNESNEDVTRVVQKYFPPGMKVDETLKLMHQLKNQGFYIWENRLEGARAWPDGKLEPYREETTKQERLALDPTGLMVNYTARKRYEHRMLIFEKHVVISIRTDGEKIVSSSGRVIRETHVP